MSLSANSCVASARGAGLSRRRNVEVIGAEAHAVFAQGRARGLIEPLHVVGDFLPLEHAERLDQLERDAARDAGDVFRRRRRATSGPSSFSICALTQWSSRACTGFARGAGQLLVGENAHARTQHVLAGGELADRVAGPADGAVRRQHELLVGGLRQTCAARASISPASAFCAAACSALASEPPADGSAREAKALEPADRMALDRDFAGLGNFAVQCGVLAQPPHQHAGAAIDEARGETLMQGVRELVLDIARDALPMFRIRQPVGPVGNERPGPNMRDPC